MQGLHFSWNETKAAANRRKHGVDFREASTVFLDDFARLIEDAEHSVDEDRFILLGLSAHVRMLVVCHCYRRGNEIRIISARKASKHEQSQYWELRHET